MENRNSERPENPSSRAERQTHARPNPTDDDAADLTQDIQSVENETQVKLGGDIGFDRVIGPDEAGLGGGLDQAEEARLGVTDEELEEMVRSRKSEE
jgi:hypothetical protein